MKLFNNFIKIIKKSTILEKVIMVLLIVLLYTVIYNIKHCKEGFSGKPELITKTNSEIFDDFYVDIYDNLVFNRKKNDFEIDNILDITKSNTKPSSKPYILDIGCGTGHHVNNLQEKGANVIGIDKSSAMIKKARNNYPDLTFNACNAIDQMAYEDNTFTHITCLYFTIYYIKNKKQLLENCYKWLAPNGKLILHLVDINKFDHEIMVSPKIKSNNNERVTKNIVNFNNMDYKSEFKSNKSNKSNKSDKSDKIIYPNAIFKETFKMKDSNTVRINEHKLYMSTQKSILSLAKDIGFTLESQVEMDSVKYKNHYLYTLGKGKGKGHSAL